MLPIDPLRVLFILHDGLSAIQVVPLGFYDPDDRVRSGRLSGRQELSAFVKAIGLDCLVRTRATRDQLVEREFLVRTPEEVVLSVQSRLAAESKAIDKIIDGEELTESDNVALSPLEHFVLGASTLSRQEGARRVAAWFDDRDAKHG